MESLTSYLKKSCAVPSEYQLIQTEIVKNKEGFLIHKNTYEMKLTPIYRIAVAALAFLATVTVVPYLFYSKRVATWWQHGGNRLEAELIQKLSR